MFAALLLLIKMEVGYVLAAGAIGLLNNLTFVVLMEMFPERKDRYTIYVLMGWAISQVTLGLIFYLISDLDYFFLLLFVLTLIYTIATFVYIKDTPGTADQPQL